MNSEELKTNANRIIINVIASNSADKVLKLLTSGNKWYYLPGNSRYFESINIINESFDIKHHKTLYKYSDPSCCISVFIQKTFFEMVETRAQLHGVYELPEEFVKSILEMIAFA